MFTGIYYLPELRELHEFDQFRQLRRYKVKAGLHCTDEAQKQVKTRVCSYPAPFKTIFYLSIYSEISKVLH